LELNGEPLLVNYVDTWRLRPAAVTRIPNFFLASDYVRTYTDLATMEAANEAARRAVNGVIRAARADVEPCELWDLHEPEVFLPLRAYDRTRYRSGLPWDSEFITLANSALRIANSSAAAYGGPSSRELAQAIQEQIRQLLIASNVMPNAAAEAVADTPEGTSQAGLSNSEAGSAAAARASSDVGLRQLRVIR
jgi:hypothetical protein